MIRRLLLRLIGHDSRDSGCLWPETGRGTRGLCLRCFCNERVLYALLRRKSGDFQS